MFLPSPALSPPLTPPTHPELNTYVFDRFESYTSSGKKLFSMSPILLTQHILPCDEVSDETSPFGRRPTDPQTLGAPQAS